MKPNKTTITLITVGILVSGLALASPGFDGKSCGHHERGGHHMSFQDKGDRMLERLSSKLALTDDQQVSVRAIMDASKPQRSALRDSMKDNKQALRDAMRSDSPDINAIRTLAEQKGQYVAQMTVLRAETRAQINAVLSAEQRTKMKEMREHRRERFNLEG